MNVDDFAGGAGEVRSADRLEMYYFRKKLRKGESPSAIFVDLSGGRESKLVNR